MQIVANSPEGLNGVVSALADADCLVHQVDATTCNVRLLDSCSREHALLELRFFVAAWTAARPDAVAAVATAES